MRRSDDPSQGLGKPEQLKHNLSEMYSRRLSEKDRLIYRFDEDYISTLLVDITMTINGI